jgi:hypothetical protein
MCFQVFFNPEVVFDTSVVSRGRPEASNQAGRAIGLVWSFGQYNKKTMCNMVENRRWVVGVEKIVSALDGSKPSPKRSSWERIRLVPRRGRVGYAGCMGALRGWI